MAGKQDALSTAAKEVVSMDQQQNKMAISEAEDLRHRIAESYELAGRVQAFTFVEKVATVASLVQLDKVKKSKVYRDLPGIGSWESYCNYLGLSRRTVDENLQNLAVFGEQFLATVATFSMGYRELRRLRKLSDDGTLQITDTGVTIGDETISWSENNKADIQDALERLVDAKNDTILELGRTIKTKEKLIEAKQHLITRQEKDLARYEADAENRTPEEFELGFVRKMQASRTTIEGWLNGFDPALNPLPEGYTPRMANEYMLTLQALLRATKASYDTAAELYGDPDLDGGDSWIPPNMRTADGE